MLNNSVIILFNIQIILNHILYCQFKHQNEKVLTLKINHKEQRKSYDFPRKVFIINNYIKLICFKIIIAITFEYTINFMRIRFYR